MSWDIVGKRKWFLVLSAVLLIPGIVSLLIPPSLTLGLEFSSGSALEVRFEDTVQFTESDVRAVMESMDHPEAIIQVTGDNGLLIRTDTLREAIGDRPSEQSQIRDALNDQIGPLTAEGFSFESVSPVVARETVVRTIWASVAATIGILIYVTWAFRNVPNPVRYGLAAIVALVHDVVIVIGIFSILGKALGIEVDVIFMVGLLTIAGYSVNDTIVVFDRIRENVARSVNQDRPLSVVINTSLLESMARSLNTSLTTMLVIVALLLIGGSTIRPFLLVLACGVVIGTYSSIFVASQFLGDVGPRRTASPAAPATPSHLASRCLCQFGVSTNRPTCAPSAMASQAACQCSKGNRLATTGRALPCCTKSSADFRSSLPAPDEPRMAASRNMTSANGRGTSCPLNSPRSTSLPYWPKHRNVERKMGDPTVSSATSTPASSVRASTTSEKSTSPMQSAWSAPKSSSAPVFDSLLVTA